MNKRLKEVSTEDLRHELKRREAEAKRLFEEKLERDAVLYLKHIDALLELTPEHARTSCSDGHLINADRGCLRCHLVESKRDNYWDHKYILHMHVTRV